MKIQVPEEETATKTARFAIYKKDDGENPLENVVFKFYKIPDDKSFDELSNAEKEKAFVTSMMTDSNGYADTSLDTGYYCMEEISLEGFKKPKVFKLNISEPDKIYTLDGEGAKIITKSSEIYSLVNYPVKVTFSKKDLTNSRELPGAEMKLTYTGEGDIGNVTSENETSRKTARQ